MDRRAFLRGAGAAALGLGVGADLLGKCPAWAADDKSRVAVVQDERTKDAQGDDRRQRLGAMVHLAVREAVAAQTPREAYQALFTATDVVAIKVNCSAPQFATDIGIVRAIIEGLHFAGVPDESIIIYDKDDSALAAAGYTLNATGPGPRCYGTVGTTVNPGYEDDASTVATTSFRLSKIVTRTATAIINVPIVKDNVYAGISGALKNHFGSISNPSDFHYKDCDPAIADVNATPEIRAKQRLIVVDALRVLYDGGPSHRAESVEPYHAVCAATDPVAVDAELAELVDMIRQSKGLRPLDGVGRAPKHITTAAKPEYGLGTNDKARIEMVVHGLDEEA